MDFFEKDLEDIICNSNHQELQNRGLPFGGKYYRQLKIGNYGVADIVTVNKYENKLLIDVHELKNMEVNIKSFLQAIGYARGIQRYLEYRDFSFDYEISITLIGRTICKNSPFIYLPDFLENSMNLEGLFKIYLYEYKIDGIQFNQVYDYHLTSEGF